MKWLIIIRNLLTSEYNDLDFPFYDSNPGIPKSGWIVLFLCIILGFLVYILILKYSEVIASFVWSMVMFIPLLYYANWEYSLILHKPTLKELKLAGLMFISYIVYSLLMLNILSAFGLAGSYTGIGADFLNIESLASLFFSIFGEELVKFIPLMFFLRIFYEFSHKRNMSFIFSSIIVLVAFGLLHYGGRLTLYTVLLLQGLGTIFELFGYYKTKNLLVPYLSHLLTDVLVMLVMLIP